MKFRKKPVVIEAFRFDKDAAPEWFEAAVAAEVVRVFIGFAVIQTLEGNMRAEVGDWIVKGTKDELYPVKPEIFADIYEAVEG